MGKRLPAVRCRQNSIGASGTRTHPVIQRYYMKTDLFTSVSFAVAIWLAGLASAAPQDSARLPAGFLWADGNQDGSVSQPEMTRYLTDRLGDDSLPFRKIFDAIDSDGDGKLSRPEFEGRHAVLDRFIGPLEEFPPPADPGKGFVPFHGLDHPLDDNGIYGAIYHRYMEQLNQPEAWAAAGWKRMNVRRVPAQAAVRLPQADGQKPALDELVRATLVMGGGGSDEDFFTGGAVIVSPDGLAVTNFHIAEAFNEKLVGILADGRVVRVIRFVAGNRAADVALVQLEGSGFPWVPLASKAPAMAEDVFMVHHTENRFYTYDRGYVKRYPLIRQSAWMEVSADYAPGGSGCGIFNTRHELVGLVSMIMMGDGPAIAVEDMTAPDDAWPDGEWAPGGDVFEMGALVVKLAVPLNAIQNLTSDPTPAGPADGDGLRAAGTGPPGK